MKKSLSFRIFAAFAGLAVLVLSPEPSVLYGHGVVWELSSKKTYGFEFAYDDETPMAYAEVKVFGPDDQSKLSQTGRTDKNGCFAFIPDDGGLWLVTADDGAGHLAKAELAVNLPAVESVSTAGAGAAAESLAAAVNLPREIDKATKPLKIGLVVSIFINLALIAMVFKSKKTA